MSLTLADLARIVLDSWCNVWLLSSTMANKRVRIGMTVLWRPRGRRHHAAQSTKSLREKDRPLRDGPMEMRLLFWAVLKNFLPL